MRSLDYLIQLFPDKTGKEILEIQEQDKIEDEEEYQKQNKYKLELINDINIKGGYFKGKFGLNQHYYYKFSDLFLEDSGKILCTVETIVCFNGEEINIEKREKEYRDFDNYSVQMCERITKEDYEKVTKYLENMFEIFW